MGEAIAALVARQRTGDLACGALPDSPVRPDPTTGRAAAAGQALLRATSAPLRRLAANAAARRCRRREATGGSARPDDS